MRILFLSITIALQACSPKSTESMIQKFPDSSDDIKLDDAWFDGKAEVLTYTLSQNRYGDLHPGEAILVQVTESFDTTRQVKNELGDNLNASSVLKSNLMEHFTTGIYDYHMMTSCFNEIGAPFKAPKVTHSSQDWCGQSYSQINNKNGRLTMQIRSYFQNEGDATYKIEEVIMEDELFNLIRLGHEHLTTGEVNMLPSAKVIRLMHLSPQPVMTILSITKSDSTHTLTIEMPSLKRTKSIQYSNSTPFTILGWDDSYPSMSDGQIRTTTANLKGRAFLPYWRLHDLGDTHIRDSLKLLKY